MSFAVEPRDLEPWGIAQVTPPPPQGNVAVGSQTPVPSPDAQHALDHVIHSMWAEKRFRYECLISDLPPGTRRIVAHSAHKASGSTHLRPLSRRSYTAMTPTFRLATHFLERSLDFFYIVRNAAVVQTSDRPNGERKCFLDSVVAAAPITGAERQQIRAQLNEVAERLVYTFQAPSEAIGAQAQTEIGRESTPSGRPLIPIMPTTTARPHDTIVVSISKEFGDLVRSNGWRRISYAAQHRRLFQLAVTLVHELVHAVWMERTILSRASGHPWSWSEPYFSALTDADSELGFAWEQWFFGAVCNPLDGEMGGCGERAQIPPGFLPAPAPAHGTRSAADSVRFPTHTIVYRPWFHSDHHHGVPGGEASLCCLNSSSVLSFFDRRNWAFEVNPSSIVDDLDDGSGRSKEEEKPTSCSQPPSPSPPPSVPPQLQLQLTPLLARRSALWPRSAGQDPRRPTRRDRAAYLFRHYMDSVVHMRWSETRGRFSEFTGVNTDPPFGGTGDWSQVESQSSSKESSSSSSSGGVGGGGGGENDDEGKTGGDSSTAPLLPVSRVKRSVDENKVRNQKKKQKKQKRRENRSRKNRKDRV